MQDKNIVLQVSWWVSILLMLKCNEERWKKLTLAELLQMRPAGQ